MPRFAGGNDAVEEPVAHLHALHDLLGLAKPHGVFELVVRHGVGSHLQNVQAQLAFRVQRPAASFKRAR